MQQLLGKVKRTSSKQLGVKYFDFIFEQIYIIYLLLLQQNKDFFGPFGMEE